MYSDRELLALAARASGLLLCGYSWIGENEGDDECEILEAAFVKHHPEQDLASKWNPLTDDGDALRLAVKLGMGISFGQYAPLDVYSVYISKVEHGDEIAVGCITDGDEFGVVRRAIVRAAAAIGEAMQ